MALVHIDLSELDALRDSLKENKLEKEKLQKEIEELKLKHSTELKDLKNGSLVIERTSVHEVKQGIHIDSKALTNKIMFCFSSFQNGNRGTTMSFATFLEGELDYFLKHQYYSGTYNFPNQISVIERIIGFDKVEQEIKEYYTKKYSSIFDNYKITIEKSKELEDELNKKYFFNVQEFEEKQLVKTNKLIEEYEFKIKQLVEKHELTLENMKPVKLKLDEALSELGYKIEKGNWFSKDKIVKI